MWRVLVARSADKALARAPEQVKRRWDAWLRIVEEQGPHALGAVPGLHDEALAGEWRGYRSSRLNLQWRVIYRVLADEVLVEVERVTPHDYRK